jgi:hypothetical protein
LGRLHQKRTGGHADYFGCISIQHSQSLVTFIDIHDNGFKYKIEVNNANYIADSVIFVTKDSALLLAAMRTAAVFYSVVGAGTDVLSGIVIILNNAKGENKN